MRLLIPAVAALLALSGCQGKTSPPGEAPANVGAVAGDGLVVVSWDMLPDLTYWIFYEAGSTVAVATPESIAIRRTFSPRVVTNLANGIQYAFVMNATQDDSAAGPNSPPVVAAPRLAGASWVSGTALGAPPQNLKSLTQGAGRFVAVGDAATIFAGDFNYTSTSPQPEGVTQWTQVPAAQLPAGFAANLSSVIYTGAFIALGTDGSIISSADGLNWTANVAVPASGMNGLAFGFLFGTTPTYVAVGDGGKIYTTTDLNTTWNPVGVGITASDLTSISPLNGSFVVTGTSGTLLTSPTGADGSWTSLVSNTTSTLRSATFTPISFNIRYVAVGDAGAIVTSSDGTTWSAVTPPLTQNLRSVTVGGATFSRFLAVGQGGTVVYSDDGLIWQTASAGSSNNLASVLFPVGLYLAVGDAGANVVSR